MTNGDKATKALSMAGIDAGWLNKSGEKSRLAIRVNGALFSLHDSEIVKWAATYDKAVATAPREATRLIKQSFLALDAGVKFDNKIRAELQAAMDLLNLCSEPNQAGEGDSPKNETDEQ